MKFITWAFILICTCYYSSADYTPGHDGRPGCKTPNEIVQRTWRNNNDPTRFWICSQLGQPADESYCEFESLFYAADLKCIHYTKWQWTEPFDPPSLAY